MTDKIEDAEIVEQAEQKEEAPVYSAEELSLHARIKEDIERVSEQLAKEDKHIVIASLHGLNKEEFEKYADIYRHPEYFQTTATSLLNIHTHSMLVGYFEQTSQPVPAFLDWKFILQAKENPQLAIDALKQYGINVTEQTIHSTRAPEPIKEYCMKYQMGAFVTASEGEFRSTEIDTFIIGAMAIVQLNQLPRENYCVDRTIRTVAAAIAIESYEALEKARDEFAKALEEAPTAGESEAANEEEKADA